MMDSIMYFFVDNLRYFNRIMLGGLLHDVCYIEPVSTGPVKGVVSTVLFYTGIRENGQVGRYRRLSQPRSACWRNLLVIAG